MLLFISGDLIFFSHLFHPRRQSANGLSVYEEDYANHNEVKSGDVPPLPPKPAEFNDNHLCTVKGGVATGMNFPYLYFLVTSLLSNSTKVLLCGTVLLILLLLHVTSWALVGFTQTPQVLY